VARATTKPIFVTWMLTPPVARSILEEARVPLYEDPVRCLSGLAALIRSVEARRMPPREIGGPVRVSPALALELRSAVQVESGEVRWSEPRTKRLLQAYGIRVTREQLVDSAPAARQAAATLGWPVVVKLAAGRLIHKAALGGVRVGLESAEQVAQVTDELLALGNQHPEWGVEGVLVQEQIQDGFELLAGLSHDAAFGPTVSLGRGGPLAELIDDITVRLPPLQRGDAAVMLAELRSGPGILGQALDLTAIDKCLIGLSHLAEDLADLEIELDINPLFVRRSGRGAIAGDAALVARLDQSGRPRRPNISTQPILNDRTLDSQFESLL
jgi:succinyl-CoA synthetase beta subunit